MSENQKKEEIKKVNNEDAETEFSYLKPGEDYNSPEGPSDLSEIRCPLCPKFAKITINHLKNEIISECPDNHYMKLDYASFLTKSTDHPLSTTKCSLCNSFLQAGKFCVECNKYLCNDCLEKHKNNSLPSSQGGIHSNISLRNNNNQINSSNAPSENKDNINSSVPKHLSTLNKVNNNSSTINTEQHHVIDIKEHETHCALHNREKFSSFCLKCNKSFCEKCLEEIKNKSNTNFAAISCVKLGNFGHSIKKMKDVVGQEKLKKIKQDLDNELEVLNYIENQSNLVIEEILEKINNLKEIHSLKGDLYNLYLQNQENASLVKTMDTLETTGFKLQDDQFNTVEKLLKNLDIINIKLPNLDIKKAKADKNYIKKMKEEKKKEIQKLKEAKKEELRKKKEELIKMKEEKKKEKQKLKEDKKKEKIIEKEDSTKKEDVKEEESK